MGNDDGRVSDAGVRIRAERPGDGELLTLYASVGWTAYTSQPDVLVAALAGSSYVVTARAGDGKLIGVARAVSDEASICYLQDILVDPRWQRHGVGRGLVGDVLARYSHVRQQVLLTDAEPGQRGFYESLGFTELRDLPGAGLRGFVRLA